MKLPSKRAKKTEKFEKKLFSKSWEGKNWVLVVTVDSYKGGQPKLQITREKRSSKYENRPFAKLGRFTAEELRGIMPILEEALHHMK